MSLIRGCMAFVVSCAYAVIAAGQDGHKHVGARHVHTVSTSATAIIDGSIHPELISDQEAITVFWISIMEPSSVGTVEKLRFSAKTRSMNLETADSLLLWNAAQSFHSQYQPLLVQIQQLAASAVAAASTTAAASSSSAAASLAGITEQRGAAAASVDKLALDSYNKVVAALSPKAAASLRGRIQEMKKHMKIIPPPAM